jgi:hypothetical protein
MNRYKSGLVGYLDVLVAQTTLLSNRRTAAQISGQRMVATVVLVKALGGGWLGVSTPPQGKANNQSGETGTQATGVPAARKEKALSDVNQTMALPK